MAGEGSDILLQHVVAGLALQLDSLLAHRWLPILILFPLGHLYVLSLSPLLPFLILGQDQSALLFLPQ